jgi:hypothetical protein
MGMGLCLAALFAARPGLVAEPALAQLPAAETAPAAPYVYVHHEVSTPVPDAQAAFDRGLTLVYAYQPREAELAFRQAAKLDPGMAMAWWGIALALGPDINNDPDPASFPKAAAAIGHARELAVARGTGLEHEYIAALAPRYSAAPQPDFDALALAYRASAHALALRHADDPDAAALFAEAAMDVHPWQLWSATGEPAEGTPELVRVIEAGLALHPAHLGLMHYYIHAVEASATPGRALAAAHRLAAQRMEPAAAHLVHMPAHTFLRVGDWQSAIRANEHAVHEAIGFRQGEDPAVHQACAHCLDFLAYAYAMAGNAAGAQRAAQAFADLAGDPVNLIAVLARFHRDAALLAIPEPAADARLADERDLHVARAMWHYGRGIARLEVGDRLAANQELAALLAEQRLAPPIPLPQAEPGLAKVIERVGNAAEGAMLELARHVLAARLAAARGDRAAAMVELRAAVAVQDGGQYTEPPTWLYPVRESLAALLLAAGERREAEAVLRECLARVPQDARAQLALAALVKRSGNAAEAATLAAAAEAARANADTAFVLE